MGPRPVVRVQRMHASLAVVAGLVLAVALACAPSLTSQRAAPAGKHELAKAKREGDSLPALHARERELVTELRSTVEHLSNQIGERNANKKWELADAADWLATELERADFPVERQGYEAAGLAALNLSVDVIGGEKRDEIVVVGAHYDSAEGSPGADDNASGVAAVLSLARRFRKTRPARTLRFVMFTLEEPPHFQTDAMGSLIFARTAAQRGEKFFGMLSIESIGYYSDAPGSQRTPRAAAAGQPTTGNFIAVVSNPESKALVDGVVATLRDRGSLPVQGAILAEDEAGWSDHWSFWQIGVAAAMITDTAPFRNPHYHRPTDTADKLDFERMARTVAGLEHVVAELGGVRRVAYNEGRRGR
jgi:hypothetical protein